MDFQGQTGCFTFSRFREGKTAAHSITAPLAFASLDAVPHLLLCNVACRHRRSSNPGIAGRAWWSNWQDLKGFRVHPPPPGNSPSTGEILGLFLHFFNYANIFRWFTPPTLKKTPDSTVDQQYQITSGIWICGSEEIFWVRIRRCLGWRHDTFFFWLVGCWELLTEGLDSIIQDLLQLRRRLWSPKNLTFSKCKANGCQTLTGSFID